MSESIIIRSVIAERFDKFMKQGRALFFSAPCGFGKSTLAHKLLAGQHVLSISAGDTNFSLPAADGDWKILLIDDLQLMQEESD